MKKRSVIALLLALCLTLTGCMGGGMISPPETLGDGTPWDGNWVNMAGLVGVEKPEGFDLLTTNGALEDLSIQYATWVIGEGTEVDKNTYIYDAQVYLMMEQCGAAAEQTEAEWHSQFDGTLTITGRETVTVEGTAYELIHYDPTGTGSHFKQGVCAIWRHGDLVLVADIADTLGLDLTKTMTDFLEGFHYV